MEVGEENLILPEIPVLALEGLLHFEEEIGLAPDGFCRVGDLCTGPLIIRVGETSVDTRVLLNNDLVPGTDQLLDAGVVHRHAIFVVLDFPHDTDFHVHLLCVVALLRTEFTFLPCYAVHALAQGAYTKRS